MYFALQRAKIPTEMHICATGNHDCGVRQNESCPRAVRILVEALTVDTPLMQPIVIVYPSATAAA